MTVLDNDYEYAFVSTTRVVVLIADENGVIRATLTVLLPALSVSLSCT